MINLRWGLIAGVGAFVISILIGVISGVNFFTIILRAFVFLAVFFGMGAGMYILVNSFFPELLYSDGETSQNDSSESPGSRVNITLENTGDYAVPEFYRNSSSSTWEIGNIEDLVSGSYNAGQGIDRNRKDDYNDEGEGSQNQDQWRGGFPDAEAFETPAERSVFSPSFGDDSDGLGGLPDLDTMAMAFSTGSEMDLNPQPQETKEAVRTPSGNKPQSLKGDFNPKELAEGIRTVLSKDK
ncbi:MAG: YrzE family protein [Treponema sp.]|nr:YrzE family protein [Treponema sp.]